MKRPPTCRPRPERRAAEIASGAEHSQPHRLASWLRDAVAAFAQASTGFALLLVATLWSFVYFHVDEQQRLMRAGAERMQINLAAAFAEHVNRSVKEIDASLLLLRRAMVNQGASFRLADYASSDYFKSDIIMQIASVDARGVITDTNLGLLEQRLDFSDREHIRFHLENPEDTLFISSPLVGRVSGRWSIQFTRKILDGSGKLAGVLVASVNPESFSNFYSSVELDGGAITLLGGDGVVRARGGPDVVDQLSRRVANLDKVRESARARDCFSGVSGLDGVEKLLCARQVSGTDLYVVVSKPLELIDDDIEAMRRRLSLMALALTIFCTPLIAAASLRRYRLSRTIGQLADARKKIALAARDLTCALENMTDGIMLLDAHGAILVSNDQAFALLGLNEPAEERPQANEQIRKRIAHMEIAPAFDDLAELGDAMRLDVFSRAALCAGPDGRVLNVRTKRLEDGGFVRTISDVTRTHSDAMIVAKALDDAQAAGRARSDFLARMSHEIRTPLHAVLGFSRMLAKEPMPTSARNIADMIHQSSAHLIDIVDDILDFSSAEAGRLTIHTAPLEIAELVQRLETIVKPLAAQKRLTLRMIIESDTPKRISTDQRRLLQILTNLLSNAIKFTDVGSVTLRVARETKKDALRFSVEDTGCGIDPATSYALFEAFNRDERTADKPGSGLGLAIVKELSTLLGGSVQATGKLGAGSIFSVTIPTTHAREAAAKPPRKTRSVKRRPLDVLVAEDTYASMLLIRLMLEKRNCLATCVEDGEAAVAAARARDFDLILLDIQMPKANGFEAAAAIRALQRQGRRPFISALTAQVLEEDQARAHAVGMDHMLRKPFEDAELDDLLERAAEAADAHMEKAQPASAPT